MKPNNSPILGLIFVSIISAMLNFGFYILDFVEFNFNTVVAFILIFIGLRSLLTIVNPPQTVNVIFKDEVGDKNE